MSKERGVWRVSSAESKNSSARVEGASAARRALGEETRAAKERRNPTVAAVVIRMPHELHEAIRSKAASEERSMAQAMRYALRRYVDEA